MKQCHKRQVIRRVRFESVSYTWMYVLSICTASDRKEVNRLTGKHGEKWTKKVKEGGRESIASVSLVHEKAMSSRKHGHWGRQELRRTERWYILFCSGVMVWSTVDIVYKCVRSLMEQKAEHAVKGGCQGSSEEKVKICQPILSLSPVNLTLPKVCKNYYH